MVNTLIWDFDNTLGFRKGMWSATVKELLDKHGYEHIAQSEISDYMQGWYPWANSKLSHTDLLQGKEWWTYINENIYRVLKLVDVSDTVAQDVANQFRSAYLNIERWSLFQDTIKTLQLSRDKGFKNYIFSNHTPELDQLVEGLGLAPFIDKTVTSALVGYEKPHAGFFKEAFTQVGESSKNCVMIGDNYFADVEGALNFGFQAILVHTENSNRYKYYSADLLNVFHLIDSLS